MRPERAPYESIASEDAGMAEHNSVGSGQPRACASACQQSCIPMANSQRESARRMVRTGMREARPVPTRAPRTPPTMRFDQQRRIESAALQVQRSADEREAETEGKIGSDDASRIEWGEAEQREGAECSCARRREADFRADGQHGEREPARASWCCRAGSAAGRKWR